MPLRLLPLILLVFGLTNSVPAQVSGTMELVLSREGLQWKGAAKLKVVGRESKDSVRDLNVRMQEIGFVTTMLSTELQFSGSIMNETMTGTIEGFQAGSRVVTGTWTLARDKAKFPEGSIEGPWAGSFSLAPVVQQRGQHEGADADFNSTVSRPAYDRKHPKVLFDEAHNNNETSTGRYRPFADLIRSDGYTLAPNTRQLTRSSLDGYEILVVVNASGSQARRDVPAFTEEECEAVSEWVSAGGRLLLVTDHPPFSLAMKDLFKRFNVEATDGFTIDPSNHFKESGDQTELEFTRENGLIGDHPITRGRDTTERINRIISFSGTSLKGPAGSVAILKLADTALDVLPPHKKATDDVPVDHRQVPAAGRAQGIALEFGKGRVVVLGEAAMLTAQVAPKGFRFGMNVSGTDNRQLALNILHWLSGLLK